MKLYKFNPDNKETCIEIELDNISFCFSNISDGKDNSKCLQIIFAAHVKQNNELIILNQNWEIEDNVDLELANLLCKINLNANFFLENKDVYIVDFTVIQIDNKRYQFYGFSESKEYKFIINKYSIIGIGLIRYAISNKSITPELIFEANDWLHNRGIEKMHTEFTKVLKYEILDMSRTVRISRKIHTRAVVVKFTVITALEIEKEYVTVLSYNSRKPKRNKNNTKDIRLLEHIYRDCYSTNRKGLITVDEENILQITAYDANGNCIVLNFLGEDLLKQLYSDIENW